VGEKQNLMIHHHEYHQFTENSIVNYIVRRRETGKWI